MCYPRGRPGEKYPPFITVTKYHGCSGSWFRRFWPMAIWLCCFRAQPHAKGHMWTTVAHFTVGRRQTEGQEGVGDEARPTVNYILQISPMSFVVPDPSNRLHLWVNP